MSTCSGYTARNEFIGKTWVEVSLHGQPGGLNAGLGSHDRRARSKCKGTEVNQPFLWNVHQVLVTAAGRFVAAIARTTPSGVINNDRIPLGAGPIAVSQDRVRVVEIEGLVGVRSGH